MNMVSIVNKTSQIPHMTTAEKGKNLLFHHAEKFKKYLDIIKLPNKAIDILFNWAELSPLPSKHLSFISKQHKTVKSVDSTLALPNFFIKQIELYKTCGHLKQSLETRTPGRLGTIIDDVKKIFFSSTTSGLTLIQHLDKNRVINLSKISKSLPLNLVKGNCLLSLASRSTSVAETTWTLYNQIKKEKVCAKKRDWHLSPAVTKNLMKLGSNSLSLTSDSLKAAVLFFGCFINPFLVISITTLSFAITLFEKIQSKNHLFCRNKSKNLEESLTSLPA